MKPFAFVAGFAAAVGAAVYWALRAWDRAASSMPLEEDECPDYLEPLHVIEPASPYEYVRRLTVPSPLEWRTDDAGQYLYTCGSCGGEFVDPTAHRCPA